MRWARESFHEGNQSSVPHSEQGIRRGCYSPAAANESDVTTPKPDAGEERGLSIVALVSGVHIASVFAAVGISVPHFSNPVPSILPNLGEFDDRGVRIGD